MTSTGGGIIARAVEESESHTVPVGPVELWGDARNAVVCHQGSTILSPSKCQRLIEEGLIARLMESAD